MFSCPTTLLSEYCCFCSSFCSEICANEIRPVSVLESCEGDLVIMAVVGGMGLVHPPPLEHGMGALLAVRLLCVCVCQCVATTAHWAGEWQSAYFISLMSWSSANYLYCNLGNCFVRWAILISFQSEIFFFFHFSKLLCESFNWRSAILDMTKVMHLFI